MTWPWQAANCETVASSSSPRTPSTVSDATPLTPAPSPMCSQQKVVAARCRPPVLVSCANALDDLCVDVPDYARALARAFWPGGLTLILRARPDLGWDLGETGGTIGVRMPDQPALLALLRTFGPMAVTSANLTGEPPATSITEAVSSFGSCVAAYLDAGPTESATASSIVDCSHGDPRMIRRGTISLEELTSAAGLSIVDVQGARP